MDDRRRPAPGAIVLSAPRSESELVVRARYIAGWTLAGLARELALAGAGTAAVAPLNSRRAKGWSGELIERALGATAGSRPVPDFELIAVELKTIPVRPDGRPRESTYVCMAPTADEAGVPWRESPLRRKLNRVLWVPLVDAGTGLGERRIGSPLLWSPSPDEERVLRADWEELMELMALGRADRITARHGTALQVRPKAANARARRADTGEEGERTMALPRGFYLRAGFTHEILGRGYVLPGDARHP